MGLADPTLGPPATGLGTSASPLFARAVGGQQWPWWAVWQWGWHGHPSWLLLSPGRWPVRWVPASPCEGAGGPARTGPREAVSPSPRGGGCSCLTFAGAEPSGVGGRVPLRPRVHPLPRRRPAGVWGQPGRSLRQKGNVSRRHVETTLPAPGPHAWLSPPCGSGHQWSVTVSASCPFPHWFPLTSDEGQVTGRGAPSPGCGGRGGGWAAGFPGRAGG